MHFVKLTIWGGEGRFIYVNPARFVEVEPPGPNAQAGWGAAVSYEGVYGGEMRVVLETVPEILAAIAGKRPGAANR